MKKILLLLFLFNACLIYSQSPDLKISTNITKDYTIYLDSTLNYCTQVIDTTSNDTVKIKARAERLFVNLSLLECDLENFPSDNKYIVDSILSCNSRVENFYKTNIEPLNPGNNTNFLNDFLKLLKDPKYTQLKNELSDISRKYYHSINCFTDSTESLVSCLMQRIRQAEDDYKILDTNNLKFYLQVQFSNNNSSKEIEINRSFFREIKEISNEFPEILAEANEGLLVTKNELSDFYNDNIKDYVCIDSLRTVVELLNENIYDIVSIEHFINDYIHEVAAELNIKESYTDTDSSAMLNIKNYLTEIDTLLGSKVYSFGSLNVKIKPVTLLKKSGNSFLNEYLGFYRTSGKYTYTFGGLFPDALPAALVDQLKEDMIINLSDNSTEMNSRISVLKDAFLKRLAVDPEDSSANFGAAFTQTYSYLGGLNEEIKDFAKFIKEGNYRNGFNFSVITNTAITDSISKFYNAAVESKKKTFNILMITGNQAQNYSINDSVNFIPLYIPNSAVRNVGDLSILLLNKLKEIEQSFTKAYDDLDNMFDMNLDPNKIDFTGVSTPLDLVIAFEKSNSDFLEIKPYGVTTLKNMRTTLRKSFSTYAELFRDMKNYLDTLSVRNYNIIEDKDSNAITELNNYVQEVNTDFQDPASTTVVDGVTVNLSAWFDVPPENLLLKLKWYFGTDTTKDQTLSGLFPNANKGTGVQETVSLPSAYKLYQNYPNPFNPSTTISYDVPESGKVMIKIYNLLGKEICTLVNEEKQAGTYKIAFSTSNAATNLASGVYFYRMQTGNYVETKKLVLLK
jgi:hypothetical protein